MDDRLLLRYSDAVYVKNGREWPNVDCWGFTQKILKEVYGKELPTFSLKDKAGYFKEFSSLEGRLCEVTEAKPGDLIGQFSKGLLEHVGIFVSPNKILHLSKRGLTLISKQAFIRLSYHAKIYRVTNV